MEAQQVQVHERADEHAGDDVAEHHALPGPAGQGGA